MRIKTLFGTLLRTTYASSGGGEPLERFYAGVFASYCPTRLCRGAGDPSGGASPALEAAAVLSGYTEPQMSGQITGGSGGVGGQLFSRSDPVRKA